MNEQEVQFHAALLAVGSVSHLKVFISFNPNKTTGVNYKDFRDHKAKLIEHLTRSGYFDVYYKYIQADGGGPHLTQTAAVWIGEFYQWLLTKQAERSLS